MQGRGDADNKEPADMGQEGLYNIGIKYDVHVQRSPRKAVD